MGMVGVGGCHERGWPFQSRVPDVKIRSVCQVSPKTSKSESPFPG